MKKNYSFLNTLFLKVKENLVYCSLAVAAILPAEILSQQSYTFTNCGATGTVGPSQTMVNNTYSNTSLSGLVTTTTNGIQTWTVPYSGNFRIQARGAQGGSAAASGGLGATMIGDFALLQGEVIQILVGQMGINGGSSEPGGGGGGTYVVRPPYTTTTSILVIAGGGSGSGSYATNPGLTGTSGGSGGGAGGTNGSGGAGGTRGAGGGGFLSDGSPCTVNSMYAAPGQAFVNGGEGGAQTGHSCGFMASGGFGGGSSHGGNCIPNGGAGGGFSGGGGSSNGPSGGGGSLNQGTNQTNTAGNNSGHGMVVITELCSVRAYATGASNSVSPVMCAGSSLTLTTDAVSNYSWSTGATTNSIVVAPTTNTVYQITGTSSLNCTASGIISITVSAGLPVLSISNPSNNICLGKAVSLTASGALTYTWANAGVVNGQPFFPSTTAVYTVSGENGCGITTATTDITVAPLSVSTLASPTVVCQGQPATLTAVSAVSGYTWEPGSLNGNTVVVGPMANTIYTVTASDGTCVGTQTLSINADPNPTITVPSSFYQICEGNSITLTASGANTYTWMPGNQAGNSITVSPNGNTLYSVTGENSFNCTSSNQIAVVVAGSPTVNINASKTTVCSGASVTLNASGGSTYNWTNGPSNSSYVVTPAATSVYTVTAAHTTNSCTTTKTIEITAIVPNVTFPTNTTVCLGNTVALVAGGGTSYIWNGVPTGGINTFVMSPASTSTINVTINTTSGSIVCPSSQGVQVVVHPLPSLTVTAARATICRSESNTLTVTGADTYDWGTLGSGSSVVITPTNIAFYTVTGTDVNGCSKTITYQAKVNLCAGIDEMDKEAGLINIYPNPSKGVLMITAAQDLQLEVYNELGQQLKTIRVSENTINEINLSDLSNGIYFIKGQSEKGTVNHKIIIAK